MKQSGLPDRTGFHDLKHFHTTKPGGSGKHDPKTVQAISRHASIVTSSAQSYDAALHHRLWAASQKLTSVESGAIGEACSESPLRCR